jgi:hypothetical protein
MTNLETIKDLIKIGMGLILLWTLLDLAVRVGVMVQ